MYGSVINPSNKKSNNASINTLKLEPDYEKIKMLEEDFNKYLENNKFVPLWNPHTEDIIPESAYSNLTKHKRKTRKHRKFSNN